MTVEIAEMDCAQERCKYSNAFIYFKVCPLHFLGNNNYILRVLLLCQERNLQPPIKILRPSKASM